MPRRLVVLALVAVAVAALFLWWRSDRRRIQARLEEAIEAVSKTGPEDQLTTFGKMRRLAGLFDAGFVVMARPYEGTIDDAQQLAAVVAGYRQGVGKLGFVQRSRSLSVESSRGTASMDLVLDAISMTPEGPSRAAYHFRLAWVRSQGEWWIHEAELLEVDSVEGKWR